MFGECHAHIFMNGLDYRAAVLQHKNGVCEEAVRMGLKEYQKREITYLRDGGDALGVSKYCRQIAGEYGIEYQTPIFAIHKNGHYGSIVGYGFDDLKEYHALVKRVKAEGGDFVKIMISGLVDFGQYGVITNQPLEASMIKEMVHIAHEEGFGVMVHANGVAAVRAAAIAGADTIEHGRYINRECLEIMAENKVVWVPTIVTVKNLLKCDRFPKEVVNQIYQDGVNDIKEAKQLGVLMALGSDAGAYMVFHGQGLLDEYHTFQELFPEESLDLYLDKCEKIVKNRCCY